MLAWATAMLAVFLLVVGWMTLHPAGAVLRCTQAVEAARAFPMPGGD